MPGDIPTEPTECECECEWCEWCECGECDEEEDGCGGVPPCECESLAAYSCDDAEDVEAFVL